MTRWVAGPHLHRRLAQERLVAPPDPGVGAPLRLNSTAAQVWDLVHSPRSVDEIVAALDAPVPRNQVAADVTALLGELSSIGLVVEEPSGSAPSDDAFGPAIRAGARAATSSTLWKRLACVPPTHADEATPLERFAPDTQALLEDVERMGSLGQLAHAIDLGHLSAEVDARALIQERWAANQMHCLRVEQMLLVALRRLEKAGIPHRLLKGVAVAHLDHPDPSWREFGDADVLIPEAAWPDADRAILADPLFEPYFGDITHPFAEAKGATYLTPDRHMLDVHKRLANAGLGARPVDVLFESEECFVLGGQTVAALGRPARLVHALLHWFASRAIRRGTMRDLVELADADPQHVRAIAAELQLTGVVKRSAELVGEELGVDALLDLADGMQPSHVERVLAARRGELSLHRNVLWRELTGVLMTPGVAGRADYVRRRVAPSREVRSALGVSWRTYAQVLRGQRIK